MKHLVTHKLKCYDSTNCYKFTSVLNLCGAPGGFCKILLECDQTTNIDVFTLPVEEDGIPMRIEDSKISVNKHGSDYGDIFQLASLVKG